MKNELGPKNKGILRKFLTVSVNLQIVVILACLYLD